MSEKLMDVDLLNDIAQEEFEEIYPILKKQLEKLHRDIWDKGIPVIVVFEGCDFPHAIDIIGKFLLPLDPRGFKYHHISPSSEPDLDHPFMWNFWIQSPSRGQIAIFDHSWYARLLSMSIDGFDDRIDEIMNFEKMLSDDGTLFIKFFMHADVESISSYIHKWYGFASDDSLCHDNSISSSHMKGILDTTSTHYAPWTIVESICPEYAIIKVMSTVIKRIQTALSQDSAVPSPTSNAQVNSSCALPFRNYKVKDREYKGELANLQARMKVRQKELHELGQSLIIVFEGRDASGKGGAISRLTSSLNPRTYTVVPIYAPNDVELGHHYLWRFYKMLPLRGHITIFDRSWYGRVLVERVEGLATGDEWRRAYREINDFERSVVNDGVKIIKIWLEIDKNVQLKRFIDRAENPDKVWKITADDWRSRQQWHQYTEAVEDMLQFTSTEYAPWTVIEGNDKNYARLRILHTILDRTSDI
ncbi:MAG: phosphate--AMP phosphotransferase [Euryarchaeota archaeon]|nr:phosphate--AMP phosphotransferase [Euryarchaeota archaeon]